MRSAVAAAALLAAPCAAASVVSLRVFPPPSPSHFLPHNNFIKMRARPTSVGYSSYRLGSQRHLKRFRVGRCARITAI